MCADLHRCVVNLYIYMFLPHFDGLLRLILYRDYNGKRFLAADPSMEWFGPVVRSQAIKKICDRTIFSEIDCL